MKDKFGARWFVGVWFLLSFFLFLGIWGCFGFVGLFLGKIEFL